MRSTLIILCVTFLVSGAVVTQAQEPSLDDLTAVVHGKDSIKSCHLVPKLRLGTPSQSVTASTKFL